jgi:hypothetical protein
MGLMRTIEKSTAASALAPSSGAQASVACCSIQPITFSRNVLSRFTVLPGAGNLEIPRMSTLILTTRESKGRRTFHRGGSKPISVPRFHLRTCRPCEASNGPSAAKGRVRSPCSYSSQYFVVDQRGWGCSSPSLRAPRGLRARGMNSQAG